MHVRPRPDHMSVGTPGGIRISCSTRSFQLTAALATPLSAAERREQEPSAVSSTAPISFDNTAVLYRRHGPNEKDVSHYTRPWQTLRSHFEVGPLAARKCSCYLLSCLRQIPGNGPLQLAPDEARTTAILPGGELIDRIQNIAGNIADRQHLNSRWLGALINRLGIATTSNPEIKLIPSFPAINAASFVILLIMFIYFVHIPHLFLRELRGKVSKRVSNFRKRAVLLAGVETVSTTMEPRRLTIAPLAATPGHLGLEH